MEDDVALGNGENRSIPFEHDLHSSHCYPQCNLPSRKDSVTCDKITREMSFLIGRSLPRRYKCVLYVSGWLR